MKRLTGYLPFLAPLLGIVGLLLRRWQLRSCFDEAGLPIPGLAFYLLSALTAAMCLGLLIAVLPLRSRTDWVGSFGAQSMPLLYLPAVGVLLSGVSFLMNLRPEVRETTAFVYASVTMPALMVAGCLLSAAGLCIMARGGTPDPLAVMFPGFGSCFWLINVYHSHASDPVVQHFAWFILTAAASSLAWYSAAGFALQRGKIRPALGFALLTVFLSVTSLAGGESLSDQLMLLSQTIALTCVSLRLTSQL